MPESDIRPSLLSSDPCVSPATGWPAVVKYRYELVTVVQTVTSQASGLPPRQ